MSFRPFKKRIPLTHGLTRAAWEELRQRVLERDRRQCIFYPNGCINREGEDVGRGTDGYGKGLIVDHIVPWSESHNNSTSNLRTLCIVHNSIIAYRKTVNPFLIIDNLEEVSSLNAVDRDLEKAFGVLRA